MPKVSVGILTFNRRAAVLKAIQSVYDQGLADVEIVVVDSASTDGTRDAVRTRFPHVKLIRLPRNLGCVGGRNHVYANCNGNFIVNVDDDGFLGEAALQRIIDVFESDPLIGIISMRRMFTDELGSEQTAGDGKQEVGSFSGGLSAFRRVMLDEIGYYPEDFFYFSEEAHLAIRALDAGYKIVHAPDVIMWHPRLGPSSETRWDYYRLRNPLLVVLQLFPGWLLVKYLVLRTGSYFLVSLKRGTPHQYLRAVGHLFWHLPATLRERRPCSATAVRKYLRLTGRAVSG